MAITKRQGSFPHVQWIDLKDNGVLVECAVLREDEYGNTYFIEIPAMDQIDKTRLARIVTSRNATNFQLWDLMSQVTLNNGLNALEYFHQLVKIITPEGIIMNPRAGTIGTGKIDTNNAEQMAGMALNNAVESVPQTLKEGAEPTPAEKRAATMAAKKAAEDAGTPPE